MRVVCDGIDIDVLLDSGETRVLHLATTIPPTEEEEIAMIENFKAQFEIVEESIIEPTIETVDYESKYIELQDKYVELEDKYTGLQDKVSEVLEIDIKSIDTELDLLANPIEESLFEEII